MRGDYSIPQRPLEKLTQLLMMGFCVLFPLFEHGNTWFLIALALVCMYQSWAYKMGAFLKENWVLIGVPALLLVIRIIGTFYAIDVSTGIKEATRSLSFLFLPFSFLVLAKTQPKLITYCFWSLTIGCLLAAIICWTSIIQLIISNNEPFSALFTWKKSNVYLTRVIDIHPPYLGALVLTVIIYLFQHYIHKKQQSLTKLIAILLELVFLLFLFHLVVRNSMLFLVLLSLGYALYFKQWKALLIGVVLFAGLSYVVVNDGTNYLQRKYYKMLDFSNDKIGDKRFVRLKASWNVFKEHPVIGAGMGKADQLRLQEYKKMNDKRAVKNDYNSHNQYMEYLCTFGILGLLVFLGVLFFFMKRAIVYQEYFLAILLCLFMFACLTESFLERELGVKYLSFIAGLILYKTHSGKTSENP